jgi:hypothetical protein
MRRNHVLAVAGLAGALVVGIMPVGQATPLAGAPLARTTVRQTVHHAVHQHAVRRHNADQQSLNWAGYASLPATGQKVTAVTGNWVVPTANLVPPGFSATWTGIGGYNTGDLIQAGTTQDSLDGYYAWYEILPASETPIDGCTGDALCTVNPGDAVSVDIHSLGGSQWSISMTNKGHWTWSKTLGYPSTFSSAEWIVEAPTLLVAQTTIAGLSTVTLDRNTFAVNNGPATMIAQGHSPSIALSVAGLVNEATPSALDAQGDGFNVCTYKSSCPAPS